MIAAAAVRVVRWLAVAMLCTAFLSPAAGGLPQPSIGLNKFDLIQQYFGRASGGNGSAEYIRLERAMAAKAIADAHDLGVKFFRVAMTGYAPSTHGASGDLELWIKDPDQYWAIMDSMMAELRRNDIRLVATLMFSSTQFPAMTGETTGDLFRDPNSRAWHLLAKYVTQFVSRYRDQGMILFYELTNELNVGADIDLLDYCGKTQKPEVCAVMSNFTTADLVAFTGRFVALIKAQDPAALVTSGFAVPRPAAEHLRRHPAAAGQVDWTPDSAAELTANLALIHQNVDIISVHLYPGEENGRFGSSTPVDVLAVVKQAADTLNKPLFIGEFGDLDIRTAAPGSFVDRMLDEIVKLGVPYSALWVWEFYQSKPYLTYDTLATRSNIEPGYTDRVLAHVVASNRSLGVFPPEQAHGPTVPRVVITWPVDCRPYDPDVPVQAVASAAAGPIAKVEFWLDASLVETVATIPYGAHLTPDRLTRGDHRLVAKAYDSTGKVGEYQTVLRMGNAPAGSSCPVR